MHAAHLLPFLAALAAAAPQGNSEADVGFTCGTEAPDAEQLSQIQALAADEAMGGNVTAEALAGVNVKVYFHVVAAAENIEGGWVSDTRVQDQLDVLNTHYNKHDIAFTRAGLDRRVNVAWANNQDLQAMRKTLRKGSYRDLNIYIQKEIGSGGKGAYPRPISGPEDQYVVDDGVQLLYSTLPGGADNGMNDGKIGVHEVGHWFGLLHTFQGGCEGDGDFIADTPAEAPGATGCPEGRDSCPGKEGKDPIHNFMDYTKGYCMTKFTAGQKTRMHNQWNTYRAGK